MQKVEFLSSFLAVHVKQTNRFLRTHRCQMRWLRRATLPNHVALATRCEVMRLMTDNKVTSKRKVETGFVLDETREARASAPSESEINYEKLVINKKELSN